MDIKEAVFAVSILLTVVGYVYYFRDIFRGVTRPHAFTWLVWATLTAIAFLGQLSDDAGLGAWITGITAFVSFFIFFLAMTRGEKNITKTDKIFLGASVLAIIPWLLTNDPLISVVLVTVIDFLGFLPTIRKSIKKPHEETLIAYFTAGLKFMLSIIALDNYTVVTWLYPASLVLGNWLFVVMLVVLRRKHAKQ